MRKLITCGKDRSFIGLSRRCVSSQGDYVRNEDTSGRRGIQIIREGKEDSQCIGVGEEEELRELYYGCNKEEKKEIEDFMFWLCVRKKLKGKNLGCKRGLGECARAKEEVAIFQKKKVDELCC